LYQQILKGVINYEALGERLLKRIGVAQVFRDLAAVEELARVLRHLPIPRYRLIGEYYEVWLRSRRRDYDVAQLERVIDQCDDFKARGLMLRAAIEGYKGDLGAEMYFYKEAMTAAPTISEYLYSAMGMAVVKAKEGSHAAAIKDLESMLPHLRYADPLVYFDTLNSYAVELAEVGRREQARHIAARVVATPFAYAYPAWLETAEELRVAERCTVMISTPARVAEVEPPAPQPQSSPLASNIVALPLRPSAPSAASPSGPARVIAYRRQQAAEQPAALSDEREIFTVAELPALSLHDKQKALLTVIFSDDVTHATLDRLLACAGCVMTDTPAS
jgi:hypothetical protein